MKEALWLIVAVAVTVLLGVALSCWSGSSSCTELHDGTGLPTKYTGYRCYVQVHGQWVPESAWRVEH